MIPKLTGSLFPFPDVASPAKVDLNKSYNSRLVKPPTPSILSNKKVPQTASKMEQSLTSPMLKKQLTMPTKISGTSIKKKHLYDI